MHTSRAPARASSTAWSSWGTCSIRTRIRIRVCRGAGSGSDPDGAASLLGRITTDGLVAEEAGAGLQVEAPAVVGADERRAEEIAVDERVALVRAGVGERIDAVCTPDDHDLVPVQADDGAIAGQLDSMPAFARRRHPAPGRSTSGRQPRLPRRGARGRSCPLHP